MVFHRSALILEASNAFVECVVRLHQEAAVLGGISYADYKAVQIFSKYGSMTAGDLAARSGLTTGAVTGLIARLKSGKFIRQTFDPKDFRKVILEPNRGRISMLMDSVKMAFERKTRKLFSKMSTQDVKVLEQFFRQFTA